MRNFILTVVDESLDVESVSGRDDLSHGYDLLKKLDPVAANRIHPNNHRKVRFMICDCLLYRYTVILALLVFTQFNPISGLFTLVRCFAD